MSALARLIPMRRRQQGDSSKNDFTELNLPFKPEEKSERTDNTVITSKYTWYNFVFIATALQFRRAGNAFFLSIVILLLIGNVVPNLFEVSFTPWGTLAILVFVVGVAVVSEGIDDWARASADKETNDREAIVVGSDGAEHIRQWRSLRVGEIVKVMKNEQVPADLVITRTAFEKGYCYIETSGIDGETNLKLKSTGTDMHKYMAKLGNQSHAISGTLKYEQPNAFLQFQGQFLPSSGASTDSLSEAFPIEFSSVVLRGSQLRNTAWIEGIIVYAGAETKLVLSSRETPSKFSRLDVFINRLLGYTFIALVITTFLSTTLLVAWVPNTADLWYFMNVDTINTFILPGYLAYLLTFFSLLSNMVPISLYFCLEILNRMNKYLLGQDALMYHSETNKRADCRTGNLIAEIGQVTHVFSDKTGTLTNNEMRLVSCSLGKIYGFLPTENMKTPPQAKVVEIFQDLIANASTDEDIEEFLRLISLCHTVVIDHGENGEIQYNAEGPDEEALVSAAAKLGYALESTDAGKFVVNQLGTRKTYAVLAVNGFTSDRKRMSVIVQDMESEQITLYMKGADNMVLERCSNPTSEKARDFHKRIDAHLDVFSSSGLRTLVLAKKTMTLETFTEWQKVFKEANLAGPNRRIELDKAAEKIERDCELVGVTAIEDALQKGVPETIKLIRSSGIKLVVLTGDKVQTAINIALSAKLLDASMQILKLSEVKPLEKLKETLRLTLAAMIALDETHSSSAEDPKDTIPPTVTATSPASGNKGDIETGTGGSGDLEDDIVESVGDKLALVISGGVLEMLLQAQKGDAEAEHLLYELTCVASVVLACRTSPKQKALFVKMVSHNAKGTPVSLAIGDGANDVAMIQEARVGVGISGHEGLQAVNSADFSIAQFRFLQRLLFVHGRWNYYRACKLILFIAYTWQVTTWVLFFFLFFSMFSGQQIYFQTFYLTFFAWVANSVIVAIVWFERDISAEMLIENPWSYIEGMRNAYLSGSAIFKSSIRALLHGGIIFIAVFVCAPYTISLQQLGVAVYTASVSAVFARQGVLTTTYIWFTFLAYLLDIIFFLVSTLLIDLIFEGESFLFNHGAGRLTWLTSLWVVGTVVLIEYAFAWSYHFFQPSPFDALREIDRGYVDGKSEKPRKVKDALHVLAETGRNVAYPAKVPLRRLRRAFKKAEEEIPEMQSMASHRSYDYAMLSK